LSAGGKLLLTANPNYMRGPTNLQGNSFQKISWADKNDDGVVNILDLADAATRFGAADSYWVNPMISPGTTVNVQDLATVAFYFGHGITTPFLPAQLIGLDPQVDPYKVDLTASAGPVMYYEGGLATGGSITAKLAALSGTPNPASFTGTLLSPTGVVVGTATGTAGGSPSVVLLSFSGLSASTLYTLQVKFTGSTQPIYRMQIQA
jgi:hypothetical protein